MESGPSKLIEVLYLGIRECHFIENEIDILAGIEAFGQVDTMSQSKLKAGRKFDSVLLTTEGQILKWNPSG